MDNISYLFKKESLLQSTGIVLSVTVLQRVIDMIRGIIFARTLGPESYGTFSLVFLFLGLIYPFACLGLPSCYSRYTPQYENKGMVIDFFRKTIRISFVSATVATFLTISFPTSISYLIYGISQFYYLIIIAALAIIPSTLLESLQAFFAGLRSFKLYSMLHFSISTFFMLFGILLLFAWEKLPEAPLLGYVFGTTFSVIIFLYIWKRRRQTWPQQTNVVAENGFYSKMLRFSLWYTLTPIIFSLVRYVDRWMLNRFLGLHEVGIYSVAGSFTHVLFILGMVISNTLAPNLSSMWESKEESKAVFYLNFISKVTIALCLIVAIPVAIFRGSLLNLLYGREYMGASQIVPILLILSILNSVWCVLMQYVKLVEKTHIHFVTGSAGLAANALLNFFLIQAYGLVGAAIASTLAYLIILGVTLAYNIRNRFVLDAKVLIMLGSTLILLLPSTLMILAVSILLFSCLRTNLIFSLQEKATIAQRFSSFSPRTLFHQTM